MKRSTKNRDVHTRTGRFGENALMKLSEKESPFRDELFSADQMEQHGKMLANTHIIGSGFISDQHLIKRLDENEQILIEVRNIITEAVKAKRQITPAGEWLLDNFYLIEEHIQIAKLHLPKGYSRELPRLQNGSSKGLPRVYDIALEIISHGDGRVDPESLSRLVTAYQTISVLKLGELWAIPIMLRLALIENLRRVATRVAEGRIDRDLANYWADKLIEIAEKDPKSLILIIADMARSKPRLSAAFVSEFARRLQGKSPSLALSLTWTEQQLTDSGHTIEWFVQVGSQQLAADQLSISNSINSLRFLEAMDWKEFVETMSHVEQILRNDPSGIYSKMDFTTRDMYRHMVEKIAKKSKLSESEVADKAIFLAQKNVTKRRDTNRTSHVGYYLIDNGIFQLRQLVKGKFSNSLLPVKQKKKLRLWLYVGSIILLAVLVAGWLLSKSYEEGISGWYLVCMFLLLFLSATHFSVALVNWMATLWVKPSILPRMDFSEGIPPESRTLVIIPTMLINPRNIEDLTEALEVRFLANQDKNLHFGLLTDFQDADKETMPEDESLIQLVKQKIEALNEKYKDSNSGLFFLFHRPRKWNPHERRWMGYERKRGKLSELNSLLRNKSKDNFSLIIGNTYILANVRYVITLDTDTQLPRDSARQYAGTMAHPLNRALYDEKKQIVTEGYGILQPRVGISLPGIESSNYIKLYASEPGIDPYTRTVSDVYQDLFGEGSFIGKGIYDVDIFEKVLNDRFPENRILSHDLLEGCYVRSGLISDVQLYEEYPSTYFSDVNRRHRWMRGDWQIMQWLFPMVPGYHGKLQKNPLSGLSLWKIFDNLRRSLVPFSLILLLILGWTYFRQPVFWTLVVIGILFIPSIITSFANVFHKKEDVLLRQHLSDTIHYTGIHLAQPAFIFINLPYEAYFSLDAIIRTLWRLIVSKRNLLEWNVSNRDSLKNKNSIISAFRTMWVAPLLSSSLLILHIFSKPFVLPWIFPVLALWFTSPITSWWLSRSLDHRRARLTKDQFNFIRELSRKTWAFFETFVGPEDHWLPPDNFQEHPTPTIAHRTSPTNMGLSLLANLSAYDFKYITGGQFLERTENAFQSMETLERYKGHFYNWYDTLSLKPLRPLYVSSVDSGNLAGHLLVLKSGFLELPDHKIFENSFFEALSDTLRILTEVTDKADLPKLFQLRKDLKFYISSGPKTLSAIYICLDQLINSAGKVVTYFSSNPGSLTLWWARSFADQCQKAFDDLTFLAPWLLLKISPVKLSEIPFIDEIPTLRELSELPVKMLSELRQNSTEEKNEWLKELSYRIPEAGKRAKSRMTHIERLAMKAGEFANIDYDFLYDKSRNLQSIGYNVEDRRADASYYDLLASEARFCSFVAIAQGQLPQESWFALGRLLTATNGDPVLLSWSGSMFEYLMPLLVMPTYENTLLDQTYKAAVKRQIEYGRKRSIPWGISESGYNMVDVNLNYQYKAFGVPGMGLKRGLGDETVIAPYASALALMVSPEEACTNMKRLVKEKFMGKFGFYEAVDFTPSRLPRGEQNAIIKSYMAHHQGMNLLSVSYIVHDRPMQRRFESDAMFQSAMLLLQERIPRTSAYYSYSAMATDLQTFSFTQEMPVRVLTTPNTPNPEVHLLSNGRYHVMITNAGGGYSRWKDLAITRWREDITSDNWGMFCYIRDIKTGEFWSTAYQPTLKTPENYEAIFSKGRAEFRRQDNDFDLHTEIVVSPEDDIELRRVRVTNRSRSRRTIEITSYAEVVLSTPAADTLHPAFNNLFVQTEILNDRKAILCTRRPRSDNEKVPWMFHLMTMHGAQNTEISYETDRAKFIGRGNNISNPAAIINNSLLSGSQGSVLDPIVAIKYQIELGPEESAKIDMICGITETKEAAISLIDKYQDRRLANRVFELAWTHSQVVLRQINATEADAQLYGRLASSVIYANPSLRADKNILMKNRRGQSGLWGYSISGDLPIVLLRIEDPANIQLVRQLVQAHTYWRIKGLAVDLVIWNEDRAGYRQLLHDQIMGLIAAGLEANIMDKPGGIFVRVAEHISNEDRILIQTVARAIISDRQGSLADQINRRGFTEAPVNLLKTTRPLRHQLNIEPIQPRQDLVFFNGTGGFTQDGHEYVITTSKNKVTPAPWINVLANARFGTIVSENGSIYTWSENAHEMRLTPWNNDPVTDSCGEALYIRDEETGYFWSPTPKPISGSKPYATRHGFGYSVFEHTEDGIRSEVWVYVAKDAPVKFTQIKIFNVSGRFRRLTVTGYVEWVLGDLKPKTAMHIITEGDPENGAIYARNPYNEEFSNRVAFFQTDDKFKTLTCDRSEFIGRNRTLENPAAMIQSHLSGKTGAGMDPCAAIQIYFELQDTQDREVIFKLGAGNDNEEAGSLIRRFNGPSSAHNELENIWRHWNQTLGALKLETPDQSINLLVNGWLMYQTLACRIWARSGFYQSGGAFGFRDQLQDVMALIHTSPQITRDHLLLCAQHQFVEGDVQHWWHPPSGRGVRTNCSDDYLWLPLVTCRYVLGTGDTGILDERAGFLEGVPLKPEDDSYYDLPGHSEEVDSLYNHCVRAIERGLKFGSHGIPLIGTGDWNDGMNMVGIHGKGESVWLGFFLYEVLMQFSNVAKMHGDTQFAEKCQTEAMALRENIEKNAWDGNWYIRAWFDDGSPLGSSKNEECQIDSISQSWSVLSGAGDVNRSLTAMESMFKRLVRHESKLVQLLDPPFDKSSLNPGYIKGYVPGVRENGGQYTHAAIWATMAFAKIGHRDHAWDLLSLINPINHALTLEDVNTYKVEPYVVAADVYAINPHTGRGGWTWYTGSAGWMYRLITESLIGLRIETDKLYIEPCIPENWEAFLIHYRFKETTYHITIKQTGDNTAKTGIVKDGIRQDEMPVVLTDDHKEHMIEIILGK